MPALILLTCEDSTVLLTLSGSVNEHDDISLRTNLEELGKSTAPIRAIDVTDIEYIDSHALGLIIYQCTHSADTSGKIYLVNRKADESAFVNRLINVANLEQVFAIVGSLDEIKPSGTPSEG